MSEKEKQKLESLRKRLEELEDVQDAIDEIVDRTLLKSFGVTRLRDLMGAP